MSFGSTLAGTAAVIVIGAGIIFGGTALGWFGMENQLLMSAHFQPKFEQVRRNTFEQSQAYVEGQRRDIQNLRLDWLDASGDRKAAIRSVALQRINGLPESAMTGEVIAFRNELESAQ
jgi:hypothetical protein